MNAQSRELLVDEQKFTPAAAEARAAHLALVRQLIDESMSLEDYRSLLVTAGCAPEAAQCAVERMIHRLNELRIVSSCELNGIAPRRAAMS